MAVTNDKRRICSVQAKALDCGAKNIQLRQNFNDVGTYSFFSGHYYFSYSNFFPPKHVFPDAQLFTVFMTYWNFWVSLEENENSILKITMRKRAFVNGKVSNSCHRKFDCWVTNRHDIITIPHALGPILYTKPNCVGLCGRIS